MKTIGLFLLGCTLCQGQQNLETMYRTSGEAVLAAFEEQRQVLQSSSALVMDGRKEALYGVVVSNEGHVLTKASDFDGLKTPELVIDRKRYDQVKVLSRDPVWDVVLLKVDAQGTVPVEYAENEPGHGTWIVVNGVTTRFQRRALAGVISANAREIPVEGGAGLGVVMDVKAKTPTVESVQEGSGAAEAGLKKGDEILMIADKKVSSMKDIMEAMKDRKAGEMVKVTVRRGKKTEELEVRLASKAEMFQMPGMMSRNDAMSGDVSKRRSGFPRIIQHDVLGSAGRLEGSSGTMGGPVINLQGRCVGMNIARANRAETFAIPAKELSGIAERLIAEARDGKSAG